MGDPLSTLSAVISVAGAISCTTTKLYAFFSGLQDVPNDVQKIAKSTLAWKQISQAVNGLAMQYQTSKFATEDGLLLDGIREALTLCEAALATIDDLVQKYQRSGSTSGPARLAKDALWMRKTKTIKAALQRLDGAKVTLSVALSAIGRLRVMTDTGRTLAAS